VTGQDLCPFSKQCGGRYTKNRKNRKRMEAVDTGKQFIIMGRENL
jgi:hypothetical protein